MAGQRKEGTRRTEFHPDAEDREWLDEQAEAAGMTRNEYLRRMLSEYRSGQVGQVTEVPGISSEQLDRMEANMEVLRDGLLAVAGRQELSMAAQAATMDAVRMLGGQMNRMGAVVGLKEQPALPVAEGRQQAPRLGPTEEALRRKWGDAAVDDYLRRTR